MRNKIFKLLCCLSTFLIFSNFTSSDNTTNEEPEEKTCTVEFGSTSSGRIMVSGGTGSFTDSLDNKWDSYSYYSSTGYSSCQMFKISEYSYTHEIRFEHAFPTTVVLKSCKVVSTCQYGTGNNVIDDKSGSSAVRLASKTISSVRYDGDSTVTYTGGVPLTKLGVTLNVRYDRSQWSSSSSYCYFNLKSMTYTYIENPVQRTVSFDANGHGTAPSSIIGYEGCVITAPTAPTATGYEFVGWYKEQECTNAWNFSSDVVPTNDFTLYAKWSAKSYTITYKDKGGSDFSGTHKSGYPTTHTYGTATTLKTATKTGYTFGGWFTKSACSGTAVTSLGATSYTKNITLYAKWTAKSYTITYKNQGGSAFSGTHESGYPTKHTYGTDTTLKTASRTGYTFGGWFTTSDCSGTAVTSLGATSYTKSITLYAKWSCFPYGKGLGGWYFKNNIRTQMVMFGFTYEDYDALSDSDSYGIYLYSDSGTTIVTTFSGSGRISELKSKQGRFYCTYDCPTQGATLYAKAFVTTGGSTVYSSIVSATGNFDNYYTN